MLLGVGNQNKTLSKSALDNKPIATRAVSKMATGSTVPKSMAGYKKSSSTLIAMRGHGYENKNLQKKRLAPRDNFRISGSIDLVNNFNKIKKRDMIYNDTKSYDKGTPDSIVNKIVRNNNLF